MELPSHLKNLYRHWGLHTSQNIRQLSPKEVFDDVKLYKDITRFIRERIRIWEKKTAGDALPYTDDSILSKYRFCNIFREFDRQTIAFHELLNPLRDDFPLWLLNMFYCRMVARPETIRAVGLLSFEATHNDSIYKKLDATARPRYGTPYVFPVSAIMRSNTPTRELFITKYLPSVLKDVSDEIATWKKESVYDGVGKVLPLFGFNLEFLWTEVLIDVAYQFPEHIDLFARFPIGPGSAPTFKRIAKDEDPSLLVARLARIPFRTDLTYSGSLLMLSAENWEGIGCEFRKYSNLKGGKGRKRLFKPGAS
jgi:hypothetical protein